MTSNSQSFRTITIDQLDRVTGGARAGFGPDVNTPELGPLGAPGPEFGEFSPIKPAAKPAQIKSPAAPRPLRIGR